MKAHSPYTAPGILETQLLLAILRQLCKAYGVPEREVRSSSQKQYLVNIRQVYFCSASIFYPKLSHAKISAAVHCKRSTVCSSIIKGLRLILEEEYYRGGYNAMRTRLFPIERLITKSAK